LAWRQTWQCFLPPKYPNSDALMNILERRANKTTTQNEQTFTDCCQSERQFDGLKYNPSFQNHWKCMEEHLRVLNRSWCSWPFHDLSSNESIPVTKEHVNPQAPQVHLSSSSTTTSVLLLPSSSSSTTSTKSTTTASSSPILIAQWILDFRGPFW
jgi:hypothetical protein